MRISDWSSDVCSSDLLTQSTTSVIQRIGKAKPLRSPPPRSDKGDQLRQISLRPHAGPRIVAHPRVGPVAAPLLKAALAFDHMRCDNRRNARLPPQRKREHHILKSLNHHPIPHPEKRKTTP